MISISTRRTIGLALLCAGVMAGAVGCGQKDDSSTAPPMPAPTTPAPPTTSADATKPGAPAPAAPAKDTPVSVDNDGPSATTKAAPNPTLAKPGKTVKMADGLEYTDVKIGAGDEAVDGREVVVNYVGTLKDGSEFDSSYKHNQPFTFLLGGGTVIKGWDEGVKGMKVGGKRKLVIPSALGYDKQAMPGIPADSILLFTVELMQVK